MLHVIYLKSKNTIVEEQTEQTTSSESNSNIT